MNYVVLVLEGAASTGETGGKTPLERADTPELDWLARRGRVGAVRLLPEEIRLAPEAAYLTVLGYDPRLYAGRGSLIAAALRVTLRDNDTAFCCPLISTDGSQVLSGLVSPVTDDEVLTLMDVIARRLGTSRMTFFPAVQNNSLLTFANGPHFLTTTSPRRIAGQMMEACLPQGEEAERLKSLIYDSLELLAEHPINQRREDEGLLPLNTIWPYGWGSRFMLMPFSLRRQVQGAVVSDNILLQGIARAAGLGVSPPPAQSHAARIAALKEALAAGANFVLLPVRVGTSVDVPELRQEEIERADREVVAPLLSYLQKQDEPFRLLFLAADLPISAARMPFLVYDALQEQSNTLPYDERALAETRWVLDEGSSLLDAFVR